MMNEREECEECGGQVHDPLKAAAMPLANFVLTATTEGTRTRNEAMNKLLRAVEELRSILARRPDCIEYGNIFTRSIKI
jgi:hypothetical protein